MAQINIALFLDRLNTIATDSLANAMQLCEMRGSPYVELSHWISTILQLPDSDVHHILTHFSKLEMARLSADLVAALDRSPRRLTSVPALSVHVEEMLQRAWMNASLLWNESKLRTGHLLLAMVTSPGLRQQLLNISPQFDMIDANELSDNFQKIIEGSPEGPVAVAQADSEALDQFTVDLTAEAESGKMDPILGRDAEIDLMIQILMKRRQNNPILTGDPGVGKTAVVEGFAQRIVAKDVPPPLLNARVRSLDMGLLSAGAGQRGEFEKRLRQVIDAVQSSPTPIILFIDEAHTLIGAGGQAGQGDAANLLKPALARGKLRTIAATTWSEYKLYFEKDPALTRRFQVVKIDEPSEPNCVGMLRALKSKLEGDHKVHILDETLTAAVRLPSRYIPARQLPDKAVSVLDAACASVAVALHATPPELAAVTREIQAIEVETGILTRESALGFDHSTRKAEMLTQLKTLTDKQTSLQQRWGQERDLVNRIIELSKALADGKAPTTASTEFAALRTQLATLQGEHPLLSPFVTPQNIAQIIGSWTGIPVGRMLKDEIASVLTLADSLERRVVGQRHALDRISEVVMNSRAGMENQTRPLGVFMLVGPSGVGKTETALSLAEALYGGEQNIITINMSEFGEPHSVSTLKGSPPGYVGYGEGGVLTEAVRRRPYSVVLLDEIEKAHTAVHQLFFQVFDKGNMEDGSGRSIDFKNVIFLLTSNAGSSLVKNMCASKEFPPDVKAITSSLMTEKGPLRQVFSAAFLGRLNIVPYFPISDTMLLGIIRLQLARLAKRVLESQKAIFTYDDAVLGVIASRCTESDSGARVVEAILTHSVVAKMSREFLNALVTGTAVKKVYLGVTDGEFTYKFE